MRKFNVILSLPLVAIIALVTSCSDDDEPKSKTELLTSKSWSITSVSLKTDKSETNVSSDYLSDCDKDDVLTFTKAGAYTSDVGSDDCDGDSSDESGTWAWQSNETIIAITSDDDTQELKLVSITSTTLKVNTLTIPYDSNGDGVDDTEASLIFTLTSK